MASVAEMVKASAEALMANNDPKAALDLVIQYTEAQRLEAQNMATAARENAAVKYTPDGLVPENMEGMWRIANYIASSSLVPVHLRAKVTRAGGEEPFPFNTVVANCFRVVNQALRWRFDPFAIIDETYVVGGKLGYQGKLIAAVVNARGKLSKRLNHKFNNATGDALEVTITGTLEGETEPRSVTLTVGEAKTDNQMWRKDPHQKLIYSASTKWARRHTPEVILGVLSDDDLERMAESNRAGDADDERQKINAIITGLKSAPAPGPLLPGERMDTAGEIHDTKPAPPPSAKPAQPATVDPAAWRQDRFDDMNVRNKLPQVLTKKITSHLAAFGVLTLGQFYDRLTRDTINELKLPDAELEAIQEFVEALANEELLAKEWPLTGPAA